MKEPLELRWILRPDPATRSSLLAEHDGMQVHSMRATPGGDGLVDVVLIDGERVRAHRYEVVPE
ncbi:hypothetical protein [Phytohabitans kaempferiae]|uniref:Uncharacterized protein n=1 Tax=Phytohabitans kaempferiae TaxID=1620943 RepID=A0ABV6LW30_9ACTN